MTSIPVQKVGTVSQKEEEEEKVNPTFVGLQKTMEDEMERRKKDWEKDVERMQQDFFHLKAGDQKPNGPGTLVEGSSTTPGAEIIGIKNSKTLFSEDADGSKLFRHRFDMHGFKPEDINIRTEGRRVTVTAKREEEIDGRKSTRQFNRQVDVPSDVDPDKLSSFFSDDGILTVEAPVEPKEPKESSSAVHMQTAYADYDDPAYIAYGNYIPGGIDVPYGEHYSHYQSGYGFDPEPPGYHSVSRTITSSHLVPDHGTSGQVEIRTSNPNRLVVRSRPPVDPRERSASPNRLIYRTPQPTVVHHTRRTVSPGHVVYQSSSPVSSVRTFHHSTTPVAPISSVHTYHRSSSPGAAYLSSSPSAFLSTSPTAGSTTYYRSSSSSSPVPMTMHTSSTNPHITIGRYSTPVIVTVDETKKMMLNVDLGKGYEAPEVNIKLVGHKIHVHAKHEQITEGRSNKREFSREFDLPESIEANTLRAVLDDDGRLHIGASISANVNHVDALKSVMKDMPEDGQPCKIEI